MKHIAHTCLLIKKCNHPPTHFTGLQGYGTVERGEQHYKPDAHSAATLDRPRHRAGSVPFADTENDKDIAAGDNPAYYPRGGEVSTVTWGYFILNCWRINFVI